MLLDIRCVSEARTAPYPLHRLISSALLSLSLSLSSFGLLRMHLFYVSAPLLADHRSLLICAP